MCATANRCGNVQKRKNKKRGHEPQARVCQRRHRCLLKPAEKPVRQKPDDAVDREDGVLMLPPCPRVPRTKGRDRHEEKEKMVRRGGRKEQKSGQRDGRKLKRECGGSFSPRCRRTDGYCQPGHCDD